MFNWLKKSRIPDKPKTLGQLGEERARQEYQARGYRIVAANFFNQKGLRLGEIDFIAADSRRIIFVEVKTRTQGAEKFGSAAEAVNIFKQKKILRAVKIFLQKRPEYQKLQPQIDVCVVQAQSVDKPDYSVIIIPNAVEDWN